MCGIIGFSGSKNAKQQIIEGLTKIEYRGYDSAGLALINDDAELSMGKTKGGIAELEPVVEKLPEGTIGIGHTRWATHGEPSEVNAHPHQVGDFVLVHNGIVENFEDIRAKLAKAGYNSLVSDTDTEVLGMLIQRNYDKTKSIEKALSVSLKAVRGTFGIALLHTKTPDVLYLARRSSPIVIAELEDAYLAASDVNALPADTKHVTFLNDDELAIIQDGSLKVFDLDQNPKKHDIEDLDISAMEATKEGKDHFMLKEILEQPETVAETLRGRLDRRRHTAVLGGLDIKPGAAKRLDQMVSIACGTATHAAMTASYLLEDVVDIPMHCEPASEFLYRKQHYKKGKVLGMAVSQSGETADTIAAINKMNMLEVRTHGVVNAIGSTISRITDGGTYLRSGPEISVASTKAFTSMVAAQLLIGLRLNELRGRPIKNNKATIAALLQLPDALRKVIDDTQSPSEKLADEIKSFEKVMFLGRDSLFPIALEGALKFKEITYIPAEGHPAGEMKHGPLALVDENMLVIYLAREGALFEKSRSNLMEIEARHGNVLIVTDSSELAKQFDRSIVVPKTPDAIAPLVFNVPLQLLAYYTAKARNLNIDKPRNLAKSVTVE